MSSYVPGQCNIGVSEIAARKRVGLIGLMTALILLVIFELAKVERSWYLLEFIPLQMGVTGYLQARKKFCLAFGFMGIFNFNKIGNKEEILEAELRKIDRKAAVNLLMQSVIIALALTLICYLIAR